ncbi:MAG: hypothetical protein GEU73_09080 [Chloroflexi bacterium]|nr:hypothetical protein [Chloroflexota bacterium]
MDCSDTEELRDLLVVGALPPDVTEDVRSHVESCPACQESLRNAWEAAQLLRLGVPALDPPAGLHDRVMGAVLGATNRSIETRAAAVTPRTAIRASRRTFAWVALAALIPLLLTGWLAVQVLTLQQQLQTTEVAMQRSREQAYDAADIMVRAMEAGGAVVPIQGTAAAPSAGGTLYYVPNAPEAVLVANGLPTLQQGQGYQVWLTRGETRTSAGMMYPNDNGECFVAIRSPMSVDQLDSVDVTSEPAPGGSPQPQGQKYLWSRVAGT